MKEEEGRRNAAVERARNQAKQEGYDVGVTKTEEALKAEVTEGM